MADKPPPPEGATHYEWDANGNIQITVDRNQSHGGEIAQSTAQSVQDVLHSIVQSINDRTADTSDNVAINPYLLPRVGYSQEGGGAWIEITTPDGGTAREVIQGDKLGTRLLEILADNGGIAPVWQVQTQLGHMQQLLAQGASQSEIAAQLGAGAGGHASHGNQAYALEGNATESADFKTQSFGALVVHLGSGVVASDAVQASIHALQALQDQQVVQTADQAVQTSKLYRDTEDDGYFEETQWVSATDAQGNLQGLLVIDFNGNKQIETRDILNLGGNAGQAGNLAGDALAATANAHLQRNNVEWLDANGDGVLDKRDPAFAAIRLWVDMNQDARLDADEQRSLESLEITSINFQTGAVTYADGHSDALSATTLESDTEGVRFTQMQEADAKGKLHTIKAGEMLEHEGYQGQVQVTGQDGVTRWGSVREATFEHNALRTGDWEGTAEQDQHRHGGTNVQGAPSQTEATAATDLGAPAELQNHTTQSTITEGDARVQSDAQTQSDAQLVSMPAPAMREPAQSPTNAQTVIAAGDIRIKSNAAPQATNAATASTNPAATSNTASTNTATTTQRPSNAPLAFVPLGQTSVQGQVLNVTESMVESAQSPLFGLGAGAGMGVLGVVGMGAVQSAQAVERPPLQSNTPTADAVAVPVVASNPSTFTNTFTSTDTRSTDAPNSAALVFRQVDLGAFQVAPTSPRAPAAGAVMPATQASLVQASVIVSDPQSAGTNTNTGSVPATPAASQAATTAPPTTTSTPAPSSTPSSSTQPVAAPLVGVVTLDYPEVQGETLPGTEDVVLRLPQSVLLTNDSTVNVSADPTQNALTITAVSAPLHGQVSLVNGEVLFAPDANFHGTAGFSYTVTDQYGLSRTATATLQIAAVNDAPITQGESASGDEDMGLVFTQAQLLANESDVDTATDGQVLSISRVGQAQHGTVWLDAQGNLRFVPDANYHGPAQFTYWVSDGLAADGAGAEVPATVTLNIAAVNDVPVATGETLHTNEDTTLLFDPATLLANDTDVDVSTDAQVLSITAVGSATHGTVAFVTQGDGSQRIAFTPEANYFGVASYQYTVSDGNGGEAIATVVINLAEVNDTPVANADDAGTTLEDTALHISTAQLLANDTDADSHNAQWGGVNDVLRVSAVGSATHGSVALVQLADGSSEVVFTPDANYHGPASFVYQVRDAAGAVSQAVATFQVSAVNDLPLATGETIDTAEDKTLLIAQAALLQNDTDVDTVTDGQALFISAVSNAQHGTVSIRSDGTVAFVPDANYFGTASFDYTVSDGAGGTATATAVLQIANVNDAPVALAETIQSQEDAALTISAASLLQNDSDIDSPHSSLKIARVASGTHGVVSLNANGDVVFTPEANHNNTDTTQAATFTYWVKDADGAESNPVTAKIMLSAVNDAPVAQGETVSGASEDAVFRINKTLLLANDRDIDDAASALSLAWVGNASGGVVSLDASGNVVFTPNANFNGNASFAYRVRDAAGLESATVQAVIPVAAVNDSPLAVDDRFQTYKNSTMTIGFSQLTSNDSDVEGTPLSVAAVRDRGNGHAQIVNGQVQFVANAGFTGTASFDYLSDDGRGGQTWATAYVEVKNPPNLYPSVSLYSARFWGTLENRGGDRIDMAEVRFGVSDDGDKAFATVTPQSVQMLSAIQTSGEDTMFGGGYAYVWNNLLGGNTLGVNVFSYNNSAIDLNVHRSIGFVEFQSTWRITDNQGLSNIWHFNYSISGGVTSYMAYSGYAAPVVLSLDGSSPSYISTEYSRVSYDIDLDGVSDKMAWAAPGSGVLGLDLNGDHQISNASEFAFRQYVDGAQTDLEGLTAFDTNHNGLLDAGDAQWAQFGVWEDKNADGQTQHGEYQTLDALGIASINLQSNAQVRSGASANGGLSTEVTVMGDTTFTRTDGSTGVAQDAMLTYQSGVHAQAAEAAMGRMAPPFNAVANTSPALESESLGLVPLQSQAPATSPAPAPAETTVDYAAIDAQIAEIHRQALLFNQMCNTAMQQDEPLGFVPIAADLYTSANIVSLLHSASDNSFSSTSMTQPATDHDASSPLPTFAIHQAA